MRKFCFLALLFIVRPAFAQSWSYDFSGTLADHFTPFAGNTASLSSANQTGGQLVYQTVLTSPPTTSATLLFKDASLSTSQSWTARLDAFTPVSLNQQTPYNAQAWAATSLFAAIQNNAGTLVKLVQVDLEADAPTGNSYFAGAFDLVTGSDLGEASLATSAGSSTLTLSFDATTKVIKASGSAGQFFSVSTASWNLGATDQFRFAVGFDTQGMTVPQEQALRLDNLSIAAVPEPASCGLLLAGLCAVAASARRRGLRAPPPRHAA